MRNPADRSISELLADFEQHGTNDQAALFARCNQAIEQDPGCAAAWQLRGKLLLEAREYASAGAQFEQALRCEPADAAELHFDLAQVLFQFGEVDAAVGHLDLATDLAGEQNVAARLLAAIYAPGARSVSPAEILTRRRRAADAVAQGAAPLPRPMRPSHEAPLRVGYVSAHFDQANYMKPVWGIVNEHDREQFEWHFFSDAEGDPQAAGYASHPADRWHDVRALDNPALAALVREQRLHVVVDLNAYSRAARLALWREPLAPVNVAWFNMYATSGLPGFDHLVGDPIVYRPDESALFSERVHVLPCSYLTFRSLVDPPDVTPPPGLSGDHFTLGCLAPQYKITDETLAAWAQMLQRLPDTRLLLRNRMLEKPSNTEYVRMRLQNAGLPLERVKLLGPAPHLEFLATYSQIDLCLDTFPYNGGSTTMESLYQGVPVACFTGDRWAARISASLMHFAGLDEFVSGSPDEHVEQVVRLVQDCGTPRRLATMRSGMRAHLAQASVCDSSRLAREMERFYRAAASAGSRPGD